MRIAFYAPLKPPNHPVTSGDRQMARLLMKGLECAGHTVELVSELRSFSAEPLNDHYAVKTAEADVEIARIACAWTRDRKPDLWFTYHPYYKAPDLLGPKLGSVFGIPYVTAEASYSTRRNIGAWAITQVLVADAVARAAVNICFTRRDHDGLSAIAPRAAFAMLRPFIDTAQFGVAPATSDGTRIVTVAMMRPGDKLVSYRLLARSLERLADLPWTLSVIGDGPCRAEVTAEFAGIPAKRIEWLGQIETAAVQPALSRADIYVWPGCGEAFGLAYLEAQAAGLPVVAQDAAGVPEVVIAGRTGLLTPPNDSAAFADAIRFFLTHASQRRSMGEAARRFVAEERSLAAAAVRLNDILAKVTT